MFIHRRNVLKSVLGLPLAISGLAKASETKRSSTPMCGTPVLGLVRRLNTIQHRFNFENNAFAEHPDLIAAARVWFPSDSQDEGPLRKFFFEEAAPGWSLRLLLSTNRDAYLLALSTAEPAQPNIFASDERGIIYFGVLQHPLPESYAPLNQAYPELSPLQAPNPTTDQKILRWARQVAFAGLGTEHADSCSCRGSCFIHAQPACCWVQLLLLAS